MIILLCWVIPHVSFLCSLFWIKKYCLRNSQLSSLISVVFNFNWPHPFMCPGKISVTVILNLFWHLHDSHSIASHVRWLPLFEFVPEKRTVWTFCWQRVICVIARSTSLNGFRQAGWKLNEQLFLWGCKDILDAGQLWRQKCYGASLNLMKME